MGRGQRLSDMIGKLDMAPDQVASPPPKAEPPGSGLLPRVPGPAPSEPAHPAAGRRGWRAILPDPALELEARLFELLSLLAAIIAVLVVIPFNFFQNLSPWLNVGVFAFSAVAVILWLEARRGRRHPIAMFAAFVAVLNTSWFVNGGSEGSIVLYFFDAALFPLIFTGKRVRAVLLASLVVDVALLYWLDHLFPQWIVPFVTPFDRFVDIITGFTICIVGLVVAVAVVLDAHQRERTQLVEANARLQQSLEEVRTLRGLLPICSWCKRVRDDAGSWTQIDQYVTARTEAAFTHSLCPECTARCRAEFGLEPPGTPPAP
jgi:hypothetical protein